MHALIHDLDIPGQVTLRCLLRPLNLHLLPVPAFTDDGPVVSPILLLLAIIALAFVVQALHK